MRIELGANDYIEATVGPMRPHGEHVTIRAFTRRRGLWIVEQRLTISAENLKLITAQLLEGSCKFK